MPVTQRYSTPPAARQSATLAHVDQVDGPVASPALSLWASAGNILRVGIMSVQCIFNSKNPSMQVTDSDCLPELGRASRVGGRLLGAIGAQGDSPDCLHFQKTNQTGWIDFHQRDIVCKKVCLFFFLSVVDLHLRVLGLLAWFSSEDAFSVWTRGRLVRR